MRLPSDPFTVGYLAGIIDGEGSITTNTGRPLLRYRVSVANTSRTLIEWLATMGGGVHWRKPSSNLGTKPCASWHITAAADVLELLTLIGPHLVIKKHLAQRAVEDLGARLIVPVVRPTTDDEIREIRTAAGDGESQYSIARRLGRNASFISRVVRHQRRPLPSQA